MIYLRYKDANVAMDEKISLCEFGIKCEKQGAYSAAIVALKAHLESQPTDSAAWMVLADTYGVLHQFESARAAFDQSLQGVSDHNRWIVLMRRAILEEQSGMHSLAEYWYKRGFAEPDFLTERWPHVCRGRNLFFLERFAEAEQHLRIATEIPGNEGDDLDEAWHMLGVSLLSQGRLEEATEAFQGALEVNPESDISRKLLEGLKQVEVARKMIADDSLPKVDRLV